MNSNENENEIDYEKIFALYNSEEYQEELRDSFGTRATFWWYEPELNFFELKELYFITLENFLRSGRMIVFPPRHFFSYPDSYGFGVEVGKFSTLLYPKNWNVPIKILQKYSGYGSNDIATGKLRLLNWIIWNEPTTEIIGYLRGLFPVDMESVKDDRLDYLFLTDFPEIGWVDYQTDVIYVS